jgi:MFS family permease
MDGNERSIVGITMLGHALVHTYELSIPILIPVWIAQFGVTPSTIGLVVGVGYAAFGFGSVPSGLLSDLYRSKPLVVLCFAGMSASFLVVSVAPTLAILTIALLFWGLAASIYHPVGLSLISRGVDRRGTALGYHGIAGNIGVALGPLATILLLAFFDWRVASAVLALPGLVAAPLVFWLDLDEAAIAGGGVGSAQADGGAEVEEGFSLASFVSLTKRTFSGLFLIAFVIVIFEGVYYRGALTFLPDMLGGFATFDAIDFFGRQIQPSRYLFVGLLLVGIAGQYAGGWLSDRMDPTLGLSFAFAGLGAIAILFIPAATAGVVPLLLVSVLLGFFIFGEQPLLQASIAEHSTADTRGASYGFMYAGVFGVGAAGAAITGFLLTYFDESALFAFLALVGALATLTGLYLYRRG